MKRYLSNKGRVVRVLEIAREDFLGELLFSDDNKTNTAL
jgi:hypothetical protein